MRKPPSAGGGPSSLLTTRAPLAGGSGEARQGRASPLTARRFSGLAAGYSYLNLKLARRKLPSTNASTSCRQGPPDAADQALSVFQTYVYWLVFAS